MNKQKTNGNSVIKSDFLAKEKERQLIERAPNLIDKESIKEAQRGLVTFALTISLISIGMSIMLYVIFI